MYALHHNPVQRRKSCKEKKTGSNNFQVGLDFCIAPSVSDTILRAVESKFDFCWMPLVHPRLRRDASNGSFNSFARSDFVVDGCGWSEVYGKLSNYVKADILDCTVRKNYEAILIQEISLALHLGLRGIVFTLPTWGVTSNMSQIIGGKFENAFHTQVIVKVPMISQVKEASVHRKDALDVNENKSILERLNEFRTVCGLGNKLMVALELAQNLPSDEELERWRAEPLKFLMLSTKLFIANEEESFELSEAHKSFIKSVIDRVSIVICDVGYPENIGVYSQHIRKLCEAEESSLSLPLIVKFEPLTQNVRSQTYGQLELDSARYGKYQEAILKAIFSKSNNFDIPLVIIIIGAGKGPIVHCALNAAKIAHASVKIYAVNNDPFAIMSLEYSCFEAFENCTIEVVNCDPRFWNAPEEADILISDLLGSFGDNELSPEYVESVQRHVKSDGIIIPKSYTSYVCPVQSIELREKIKCHRPRHKHNLFDNFEQLYVMDSTKVAKIAPVQELFTFVHPNHQSAANGNFSEVNFQIEFDCTVDGLSGFFDAILYDDITISTIPGQKTDGLCSWFPVYLPIQDPIHVRKGDNLSVHIWRLASERKMWYEWCVLRPVVLPIHNYHGHSYAHRFIPEH